MKRKKQDIQTIKETKGEKPRMAKQIVLKDTNGNKYTLEFDRDTVKKMIKRGFVLDTEPSHLLVLAEDLVTGAFQMHHKKLDWEHIEPIFMAQNQRPELLKKLAEMYMEPAETLLGSGAEGDAEENPTWEIVE